MRLHHSDMRIYVINGETTTHRTMDNVQKHNICICDVGRAFPGY
jgi:hypothetical protein